MDIRGAPLEDAPEAGTEPALGAAGGAPVAARAVGHRFGELEVLAGISFSVAAGGSLALVGPSGCGKSTLLELIGGFGTPAAGAIEVGGAGEDAERLARCAWMPQNDALLPWRRVVDNAALAPRIAGSSRPAARDRAAAMLSRLGLDGFADAFPEQLSGGMRQRVAFARTLLTDKPALLLDEPLAALDAITRADLQEWLAGTLRDERRTTVLVTHDVEEALYLADRVLVLSPRPGAVVLETASPVLRDRPRHEAVSDPAFVEAREHALEALAGGGR